MFAIIEKSSASLHSSQFLPVFRMVSVNRPDKSYIDYFQGVCASLERSNLFGIRVRPGFCFAVVKNGDGQPVSFGKKYPIPVRLETLPSHLRMVVDNHVLNYPASDL